MQRRLTERTLSQQPSTSHSYTYLDLGAAPSLLRLAATLPKGISVVVIEGRKCINLFTSIKFKISHLGRKVKQAHLQITGLPLKFQLSSKVQVVMQLVASTLNIILNNKQH